MNEYYKKCAFPKPATKKKRRLTVSDKTYYRVFNACHGTCQLCPSKQYLELHHVLGRGKDLTDNYRYCVMLCHNCHHNKVHKNQKYYRPKLLKICKRLYGNGVQNGEKKNV